MLQIMDYNDTPRVKIRNFLEDMNTSKQGLTDDEVAKRRAESGYNEITVKKANIDPYRCFGCGVCQRVCQQSAIELLPRRSFPALREEW